VRASEISIPPNRDCHLMGWTAPPCLAAPMASRVSIHVARTSDRVESPRQNLMGSRCYSVRFSGIEFIRQCHWTLGFAFCGHCVSRRRGT
jgi:hypothetical protein